MLKRIVLSKQPQQCIRSTYSLVSKTLNITSYTTTTTTKPTSTFSTTTNENGTVVTSLLNKSSTKQSTLSPSKQIELTYVPHIKSSQEKSKGKRDELYRILKEKDTIKQKQLIEQLFFNADKPIGLEVLYSLKNISILLMELIKSNEFEMALKIFQICHNQQIEMNRIKSEKEEKERSLGIDINSLDPSTNITKTITSTKLLIDQEYFKSADKIDHCCLEVILYHYQKLGNIQDMVTFFKDHVEQYQSFLESHEITRFFESLSSKDGQVFGDLVYFLYQKEQLITEKFSVNVMIHSLKSDPTDKTFNDFYRYHKQKLGIPSSRGISDLFSFLIPRKKLTIVVQLLRDIISSKQESSDIFPKYLHFILRLFSKVEKNPVKLVEYQNLLFSILSQQSPTNTISHLMFFYNTYFDVKEMKNEHKITSQILKRLNKEFLSSLPMDSQKIVIDNMIMLLLKSDQYEKALFWFCTSVSKLGHKVSKEAISYFTIYHNLQASNPELKDNQVEIAKQIRYYTFWKNMLMVNSSSNGDSNGGDIGDSSITDHKFVYYQDFNPYKILDSVGSLSTLRKEFEMKMEIKNARDFKLPHLKLDHQLQYQLSRTDQFTSSEIIKYLEENYLNHGELPSGTLMLDALLSFQNDEIFSKLENRRPVFIEALLFHTPYAQTLLSSQEFQNTVDVIKPILPFLSKKEDITKKEIEILKNAMFNLFYYRANGIDCIETFATMIERKIPIPFNIIEQACCAILENKHQYDQQVSKMDTIYNYLGKFTKINPTFEDGYIITIRNLIDTRKFNEAQEIIDTNEYFKTTMQTLIFQTSIHLENDRVGNVEFNWKQFIDSIYSTGKFTNLDFIFNQVINHQIVASPTFKKFEIQVIRDPQYKSQLLSVSNQTLANLVLFHKRSFSNIDYYLSLCTTNYFTQKELSSEIKSLNSFTQKSVLDIINKHRVPSAKNGTQSLSISLS